MTTENTRIVSRISHDEETYLRYGNEMMFRGEVEQAVQQYNKAIETRSDSAKAWQFKAHALEALGRFEESITCYDTALKCDAGDAECWFNKGVALKKLGRSKDGTACMDTGIRIAMGL